LAYADWPEWKEEYLVDETVTLAIQVNGKMRGTVDVSADVDESGALAAAKEVENVASHLEGKNIVREIYVPGKIVNFIAK
jgi:leucyl-tRNA synthetase